jgi:hypothetical protein
MAHKPWKAVFITACHCTREMEMFSHQPPHFYQVPLGQRMNVYEEPEKPSEPNLRVREFEVERIDTADRKVYYREIVK